jgi:hypothetical protein
MNEPIFQPVDNNGYVMRPVENSPQLRPVEGNNTPIMRPIEQNNMTQVTTTSTTTTNQTNQNTINQTTPQVQVVSQTPPKSGIHMDLIFAIIM